MPTPNAVRDTAGASPIDPAAVARFRGEIARLCPPLESSDSEPAFGLAVSGGPDSFALLILAHAAFPGRIEAATVDHGLRAAAAAEAAMVGEACARMNVPHAILREPWSPYAGTGVQAAARDHRYHLLQRWCRDRNLPLLLTAHHADDQAETVLMRLARGAGVSGLRAIRPIRVLHRPDRKAGMEPATSPILLVRPLLSFAKAELQGIVAAARQPTADDPSNTDPRYDRTQARRLLADTPWLSARRLAAAAHHLAAADDALEWITEREFDTRVGCPDKGQAIPHWTLDPADLPEEILRRLTSRLWWTVEREALIGRTPSMTGPKLTRFINALRNGETAMLGRVLAHPGRVWRLMIAPPRRQP